MDDRQTDSFWAFTGEGGCSSAIDSFAFGVNGADIDRLESLSEGVSAPGLSQNCDKFPSDSALCVWISWLDCAERGYKRLYGAPVRIPCANLISRFAKHVSSTTVTKDAGILATADAASLPSPSHSMRLPLDLQWKAKSPIFPLPIEYTQADAPPAYPCSRPVSALALSTTPPRFEPASPDVFYFNNGGCLLVHPDDLHPHSMELYRQAEIAWSSAQRMNAEGGAGGCSSPTGSGNEADSHTNSAESSVPGRQSQQSRSREDQFTSEARSGPVPGECKGNAKHSAASGRADVCGTGGGVTAPTAGGSQREKRPPKQSLEEELLNERQRRRCLGISRYVWSKQGKMIMLSNSSGVWIYDGCSAIESLLAKEAPRTLPLPYPCSASSSLDVGTKPGAVSATGHTGKKSAPASSNVATFFATNRLSPAAYMVPATDSGSGRSGGVSGPSPAKTETSLVETTFRELDGRLDAEAMVSALDEHFSNRNPPSFARNQSSSTDPASRPRVAIHPSGRSHAFGTARLLVPRKKEGGRSILDCTFSPDATRVAFVHESDIHVVALPQTSENKRLPEGDTVQTGPATSDEVSGAKGSRGQALNDGLCMLTTSGRSGKVVNGLAEYVAQEEMYRTRGYWWSPCGDFIAFCRFTEDHIKPLCLQRVRLPQYQACEASDRGTVPAGVAAEARKEQTEASPGQSAGRKQVPSSENEQGSAETQLSHAETAEDAEMAGEGVQGENALKKGTERVGDRRRGGAAGVGSALGEEANGGVRQSEEEEWSEDELSSRGCEAPGAVGEERNGHSRPGEKAKAQDKTSIRDGKQKHSEEPEDLLVQEEHHFPFAGMENVRIRVGILQVPSASELRRAAACAVSGEAQESSSQTSLASCDERVANGDSSTLSVCRLSSASLPGYSLDHPLEACERCTACCACVSATGNPASSQLCSSPSLPAARAEDHASAGSLQRRSNASSSPCPSLACSHRRGTRERFIDLPVHDWNKDFYVARAQWISIAEWSDLVALKLLTREEVEIMQAGIRRRERERNEAANAAGYDEARGRGPSGEDAAGLDCSQVSPPPVLLLQLQDRLQQELRICAALPWLPSDFLETPRAKPEDEKLRCVVCFTERSHYWINLHDDLHQLGKSLWYLWTAERKTMNELYLQSEASPASASVCLARLPKDSELRALQLWCRKCGHESEGQAEKRSGDGAMEPEDHGKAGRKRGKFWGQRGTWKIEIRDLLQPWAFVTNPTVEGTHSFVVSEKAPLVVHQHHARLSPRQIWIRYIPDWDAVLRHAHVSPASPGAQLHYSLAAAVSRGRAVFGEQLELFPDKTEKSGRAQAEQSCAETGTGEKTKETCAKEGHEREQRLSPQEADLQLLKGCEHLSYAYGDTAAAGQVLYEFQQVQRVYLRVVRSLVPPVPFELENEGEKLFGCYYRPNVEVHGPGPYRAVVSLYGGPTLQFVPDAFDLLTDMRAQALAKLGLIVVKVDNRGSYGRSIAFEKAAIHRRLGVAELSDQRAAVMHLYRVGLVALHADEAARVSHVSPSGLASEPCAVPGCALDTAAEPKETQQARAHALRQKRGREAAAPQGNAGARGKAGEAEERDASQCTVAASERGGVERASPRGRKRAKTEGILGLDCNAERTPAEVPFDEVAETGQENERDGRSEKAAEGLEREARKRSADIGAIGGDSLVKYGVGIYGISYGGYLAAMAHFTHPDFFTCCWSAAPVTAWELYSTHYTERYLSLPRLNSEGYKQSSVLNHVKFLEPQTNRLKLLHGYLDENVHMQHSLILLDKMIRHQVRSQVHACLHLKNVRPYK
ncbi:putative dipeptidyl peptidase IV domain-containing protein [Neospora caninum Liverpool]|uniref:Putative dipeptidyl peptidase IV domain-containing protein n=1 Tax=Neospora caninum (strain Liverpool) TaxID=572307 RepID=F0VQ55_NEOCL|nr:putative dipeptidyl peptidase IV domain-containing protein [Neospora caninum Liverpool]CBZ55852.1 putative dipeptidyl peptidase IV domain-containing protein [Neospora caninum Liverpool]|eukprot:XP_003885878.1 putative dipeptidyl peptidase IV domain-containing protein [Neospora caninum Liverpool]